MPVPPNDQTFLVFSESGIPFYSTRDATQTLRPVQESADIARTVNGTLVDLSDLSTYRKFMSEISASDLHSPAFDGFWPGMVMTVDCVCELCYMTGGSPSRPVVSGSQYTLDGFTVYRPQIVFRVLDYQVSFREWAAETSWTLSLAEV
jgi:hypothetical protein